ncbi:MAG: serine/arginine repetitive matrix protein 2 [Solirubrobacteraceae bacterium]
MTSFATSEGLRNLLIRMHERENRGHFAWRLDTEAAQLMAYTIRKYQPLAYTHHCAPEDSAYAAFEAMRTRAVRTAEDPWAVITRAVQVSLIAEERANDLLCAPAQARRTKVMWHHDARRFSEYETDLTEYDPAFQVPSAQEQLIEDAPDLGDDRAPVTAAEACRLTITLFTKLGWPENTTICAIDYIAGRLIECGDRSTAHNYLRRDFTGLAFLDLPRTAWTTLLRLTLGSLVPDEATTRAGQGLFQLFALGYTVSELLEDIDLVWEIYASTPRLARRLNIATPHDADQIDERLSVREAQDV